VFFNLEKKEITSFVGSYLRADDEILMRDSDRAISPLMG
jgi:hypothetical protein